MNRIRRLAEEIFAKYPTMFSSDFEANKKALEQVAIIRNRALRNQIAGAITSMVEVSPKSAQVEVETEQAPAEIQPSASETPGSEPVSQEAQ